MSSVPSDISRTTEKLMTYFFYVIGSISLLVNTATLIIVFRKSSALTPEIKNIAIFQQLSCLVSNASLTLLFIPFFYPRMGGGYCVGILCMCLPYEHLFAIQVFLTFSMISAFGVMIVARHQLLIMENSILKMPKRMRYVVYFIIACGIQLGTLFAVFSLYSDRKMQNAVLEENINIKWRERGLNWFLFYGPGWPWLMHVSHYAGMVQLTVFVVLVLAPFVHMLGIVINSRKKMRTRKRDKDKHIIHAQTIIIQFLVLFVFIVFPFIPAMLATLLEDVYRNTQTSVVIAEMVFVCSTLLNSVVIISRNRNYRSAVINAFRRMRHRPNDVGAMNSSSKD